MRKLLTLVLAILVLAACGTPTTTTTGTTAQAGGTTGGTVASPTTGGGMAETATAAGAAETATTGVMMETATTGGAAETTTAAGMMETATAGGMMETTTAGAGATTGATGQQLRVALVSDTGKINDGTFNQFAYEGMQRAAQEFGIETNYIETAQQADYERNLSQFADEDYDLVIGVGFLMGDAVQAVATKYPDTKFAIVDFAYDPALPNVKGLVFAEDQAGYLVGAAAALVSKSNKIGAVGGIEIPPVQKFLLGYENGAKSVKPDIQVVRTYLPSFTDPAAGAETAKDQINGGADVIFGAGGQTGSGGIAAAAQEGAYVIGVDQDEFVTTFKNGTAPGSDKLITSALKRVDNAVYAAIQEVVQGNFEGGVYVGTAENGGVDYAPAHMAESVITPEIKAQLDKIKEGLANGSIMTNVTLP